jgi:hypothetical protein
LDHWAGQLQAFAGKYRPARAGAPDGESRAGRWDCRWERDHHLEARCDFVYDDQSWRNDICWSVFETLLARTSLSFLALTRRAERPMRGLLPAGRRNCPHATRERVTKRRNAGRGRSGGRGYRDRGFNQGMGRCDGRFRLESAGRGRRRHRRAGIPFGQARQPNDRHSWPASPAW